MLVQLTNRDGKPLSYTCDTNILELVKIYLSEGKKADDIIKELIASDFERIHAIAIVLNAKRKPIKNRQKKKLNR